MKINVQIPVELSEANVDDVFAKKLDRMCGDHYLNDVGEVWELIDHGHHRGGDTRTQVKKPSAVLVAALHLQAALKATLG